MGLDRKNSFPSHIEHHSHRQDGETYHALPFHGLLKRSPAKCPSTTEIDQRMDHRSDRFRKIPARSLADQGITSLAFQSILSERTILVCIRPSM